MMISAAPVMMPRGRADAEGDGSVVVAGLAVALPDAAEQEHLVVHREPEEDGEEEERHPGFDRLRLLRPRSSLPIPFWKTSTSSP